MLKVGVAQINILTVVHNFSFLIICALLVICADFNKLNLNFLNFLFQFILLKFIFIKFSFFILSQ